MKKFASLLLTVALLATMLCVFALPASAETVNYIVRDWDGKKVTETTKSVSTATKITSTTTTLEPGWYVASGTVTVSGAITVNGTTAPVNLILADDCKLTVQKGIRLTEGNTLNIYGQSESKKTGTIEAKGDDLCAGIGGFYDAKADRLAHCGNLTVYGGTVNAIGSKYSAGIGGGSGNAGGNGGNVTVYGGTVNATSTGSGSGIGGDDFGAGGNLTVYGGTVNATSSVGPGIGTAVGRSYGNLTVRGGTVNATSKMSTAITDNVTVYGGTVNAKGYNAGIGTDGHSAVLTVTVYDGTVTATGNDGAGIGGGRDNENGCNVNIYGGTVTAQGGTFRAGIGGGRGGNGGNVKIYGGTVKATSGREGGAGIGGGYCGDGGNVEIHGGTVTAIGDAAGIGGGSNGTSKTGDGGNGGNVKIYGGTVTAKGGQFSAGIGGGGGNTGGNGGNVEIHGGTVTAIGNSGGAGIGGSYGGNGGNVKILGGFVTAIGDPTVLSDTVIAHGIGCGTNGSSSGELYVEPTAIIMTDIGIVKSYTGQIYFKSHFHNSETIKSVSDTHHQCVICGVQQHRWSNTDAEQHTCVDCGKTVSHSFKNGKCACGKIENHEHNYKPSTFYVCDCGEKAPEDYVPASGEGSILSQGSIWIIVAVAVVTVVGFLAAMFIFKKKKPALEGVAENKDEE